MNQVLAMPARQQVNIRLDERTAGMLEVLMEHFNLDRPGVIRMAVKRLLDGEGLAEPGKEERRAVGPPEA